MFKTANECLQVCEEVIYNSAEKIKLSTKTDPFQLPLFLQATPGEKIFLYTILS